MIQHVRNLEIGVAQPRVDPEQQQHLPTHQLDDPEHRRPGHAGVVGVPEPLDHLLERPLSPRVPLTTGMLYRCAAPVGPNANTLRYRTPAARRCGPRTWRRGYGRRWSQVASDRRPRRSAAASGSFGYLMRSILIATACPSTWYSKTQP